MSKKKYTFAPEFGPIVQWISTFAKVTAYKGRRFSENYDSTGPIVQWIEWRFPKP
jgi:hypothetical protein